MRPVQKRLLIAVWVVGVLVGAAVRPAPLAAQTPPSIRLSPACGTIGQTTVTIIGTGFTGASLAQVLFTGFDVDGSSYLDGLQPPFPIAADGTFQVAWSPFTPRPPWIDPTRGGGFQVNGLSGTLPFVRPIGRPVFAFFSPCALATSGGLGGVGTTATPVVPEWPPLALFGSGLVVLTGWATWRRRHRTTRHLS